MNDRPIQVKCIDHVAMIVKDLERSRQFYVEMLGMHEMDRPRFSFSACGSRLVIHSCI